MTVVLDTNVVISGIFWSGPPNRILKLWHAKSFRLAVSLEIIEEYRRVGLELARKYPTVDITHVIDTLVFNSDIFAAQLPASPICRDPDDDKFLVCGIVAKASCIVTGDKALLDLDGYGGIRILKPKVFLQWIDR